MSNQPRHFHILTAAVLFVPALIGVGTSPVIHAALIVSRSGNAGVVLTR